MKILLISLMSSIVICSVYHLATQRFGIPFFYTISVGIIVFSLIFFVLDALEI